MHQASIVQGDKVKAKVNVLVGETRLASAAKPIGMHIAADIPMCGECQSILRTRCGDTQRIREGLK